MNTMEFNGKNDYRELNKEVDKVVYDDALMFNGAYHHVVIITSPDNESTLYIDGEKHQL